MEKSVSILLTGISGTTWEGDPLIRLDQSDRNVPFYFQQTGLLPYFSSLM